MAIRINREDYDAAEQYSRDPFKSARTMWHIEPAPGCTGDGSNGEYCKPARSEDGDFYVCVPHDYHLVVTGDDPPAGPRYFAVAANEKDPLPG